MGYRIAEETLNGNKRAEYGSEVIKKLAKELIKLYGKGFTKSNLYSFINFIQCIQTLSGKSTNKLLSWSHYQILTQVHDATAREWYVMKH